MRIDIWSDVVCPWCYIGKRRFERALEQFPHRDAVDVAYRSFQLDPSAPQGEAQRTVETLAARYRTSPAQVRTMMERVEQTAAAEGLDYHLADTLSGNTVDAHRLLHLAGQRGLQEPVQERLFRAHFTEGRSVFDRESLVALAAEAGLDTQEAARTLAGDAYAGAVAADVAEAHALGITGVPFFVVDNRYGISGAQPTALFAQALTQAWAESHPSRPLGAATAREDEEACTDGSCVVP